MRTNRLTQAVKERGHAVNAWLSIPSSFSAEVVAHCGFDSVTVDLQHGMIAFGDALAMLQAISSTPAAPLVRPQSSDPVQIMHLLDAGAYGVICPQVDDADIARAVVDACRYPPSGQRSFGPARGMLYGGADYFAHANDEILVFVMIESRKAVANLDSILSVPGIDGVYIGPNDLSLSYLETPSSEPKGEAADVIEHIRVQVAQRQMLAGIFCADGAMAQRRLQQGFQVVTPGNDATLLKNGCIQQLAGLGNAPGRVDKSGY